MKSLPKKPGTRIADLGAGWSFIASAARNLTRNGNLWMVANRHLPYETTLGENFAQVQEVAGDNRFKVFHASRIRAQISLTCA